MTPDLFYKHNIISQTSFDAIAKSPALLVLTICNAFSFPTKISPGDRIYSYPDFKSKIYAFTVSETRNSLPVSLRKSAPLVIG